MSTDKDNLTSRIARREAIKRVGTLSISALVGGKLATMSPRQAQAAGAKTRTLTQAEAEDLAALGDTIVPGAAEAGIAQFVDHHLSIDYADSLLMLRYLDIAPPYIDFYRPALAALDMHVKAITGRAFADLGRAQRLKIATDLNQGVPEGWQAAPAPLFMFAVRGDAVDVTWGTVEGFARLGVDYLPHILPESKW